MGRVASLAAAVLLAGPLLGCASVEAIRFYRDGTAAFDRGEPRAAVVDLERAAALEPEVSAIQNHLGIAYEGSGRDEDALHAYQRAVALDCGNRAAEANLAALRERLGRPAPADDVGERDASRVTP